MTRDDLIALAETHELDSSDLMTLFDIPHDRTNNGGVAEVIDLAIEGGDDPEWMAQEIKLAGWLVIGAAKD